MKCIIIKNDGLGDLILSSGIINSLKNIFQTIDLVTCIDNKEITKKLDGINKVFYVSRDGMNIDNKEFCIPKYDETTLKNISENEYDVAIVLRRFIRSSTFIIMNHIKAKRKISCWQYSTNILKNDAEKFSQEWENYIFDEEVMHETVYYQNFLKKALNLKVDIKPILKEDNVPSLKLKNSIAICLDGRGWGIDIYNINNDKFNWVNLIDKLNCDGYSIYLFGKSTHAQGLAKVIEQRQPNIYNYVDRVSLDETINMFKGMDFYIGNDTGITHLASLYISKVFIIHGGGGLSRFFPWPKTNSQKIIVNELSCFDCCWNCIYDKPICLHNINYTSVYNFFIENINSSKFIYKNIAENNATFKINHWNPDFNEKNRDFLISEAVYNTLENKKAKQAEILDNKMETEVKIEAFNSYLKLTEDKETFLNRINKLKEVTPFLSRYEFIEDKPDRNLNNLIKSFEKLSKENSFIFKSLNVDIEQFLDYIEKINYKVKFPNYSTQYQRSLSRKMMEHFISFKLLGIDEVKNKDNYRFIDVACSTSPVQIILKEDFGLKEIYKQDLNSVFNINDKYRIVSNAVDIPVKRDFFDGITLHNSWEHFEGSDDINFIKEAGRILKKGGKFIILPLDLADSTYILTSPSVWFNKYRNLKDIPEFDTNAKIYIEENKRQRQEKSYSVEYIVEIMNNNSDIFSFEIIHYKNLISTNNILFSEEYKDYAIGACDHFCEFVLVGTKK